MSNLSQEQHWNDIHVREREDLSRPHRAVAGAIKRLLGSTGCGRMAAYDDYLLWETIFPQHLSQLSGGKVVEVGSAPGEFLVQLGQKYACVPYGLDYSEVGVQVNKQVFIRNGFNPDNVICADFFSGDFQKEHKQGFDAVISRGFIEHFSDVDAVIDRHMEILKPGGLLIISIPNLSGVNYALAGLLDRGAIPRHNTGIMCKQAFSKLFDRKDLRTSFCDYYGTFSFYLFTADQSKARQMGLKLGHTLQPFLNVAFRTLLGDKGRECGFFSPSLLYIGRKAGPGMPGLSEIRKRASARRREATAVSKRIAKASNRFRSR